MKPKLHELTDRWAALLLVLVIVFWLFAGPLSQKADAVVVSSVIVGAVIATMAMAGITFVASGMTAAQLQDWVSEKLNEWAADLDSPLDHLINSAGIGVTISGLLTIGTAASQGISDFITWLKSELNINNNTQTQVVTGEYFIGSMPVVLTDNIRQNTSYYGEWKFSTPVLCVVYQSAPNLNKQIYAFSPYSFAGSVYYNHAYQRDITVQRTSNDIYYYSLNASAAQYGLIPDIPIITTYDPLDYVEGNQDLTIDSTGSLAINAGVITIPQVQNDDKVFVDVGALPGSTVIEVTDGVISDAVTNTLDVSGEVAESEPEYVIDGPEPVYGLADVFPFCIPFDLYDFVSCLAADPVAPHFEWRLYVEDLVDYTFVIDLQQFETVAQIFRTMFLLAFIIGLAMVTRHLLRS